MKLSGQRVGPRLGVFVLVAIFFVSVPNIGAQIDAFDPCISGQTELDLMGVYGTWSGGASFRSGGVYFYQGIDFHLHQNRSRVYGEGQTMMIAPSGFGKFEIEGLFDGKKLKAESRNFNLVRRFVGPHSDVAFNKCRQFDFDLSFVANEVLTRPAIFENREYEISFQADALRGISEAPTGDCLADAANTVLKRFPDTIVVMFGGCQDGENLSVINDVYTKYVENLKLSSQYGQYVKYFAYNRVKEAKLFIYQILKASPKARIAIVGHSLGGNAAFRLAEVLAGEMPQVMIDLVITLDPVTLKVNNAHPRLGAVVPPENSRASIPLPPRNILEWINVPIKPWHGQGRWVVESGGIQWREQEGATNIILDVDHGEAGTMFFSSYAQLGNMSPANRLLKLGGLTERADIGRMLLKLDALSPLP